jgi:hypothetical protein
MPLGVQQLSRKPQNSGVKTLDTSRVATPIAPHNETQVSLAGFTHRDVDSLQCALTTEQSEGDIDGR